MDLLLKLLQDLYTMTFLQTEGEEGDFLALLSKAAAARGHSITMWKRLGALYVEMRFYADIS